jgi:hypothetical protein
MVKEIFLLRDKTISTALDYLSAQISNLRNCSAVLGPHLEMPSHCKVLNIGPCECERAFPKCPLVYPPPSSNCDHLHTTLSIFTHTHDGNEPGLIADNTPPKANPHKIKNSNQHISYSKRKNLPTQILPILVGHDPEKSPTCPATLKGATKGCLNITFVLNLSTMIRLSGAAFEWGGHFS